MLKILPLLFIMAFASNTVAEGACPPGQYQIGGQGAVACAPIPQENSVQQQPVAPRPTGEWIKTWGAIAMGSSDSVPNYGVTTGKPSKAEAEQDALQRCASRGQKNCQIGLAYINQCAVIAEPQLNGKPFANGSSEFIGANTLSEASKLAKEKCSVNNQETPGAECVIIYNACSEPIFHKY
ncbi:DUF4189 domain-containing protein [Pseudomonas syringae]|uniref:DUF4189 domain-containing protein n=1 Tax=Pseudomonas syringae TaxID=317 RepID=UPI001E2E46EF|nr:DUF4189 domain-containing protein [Pseudomonas syringae]